jgi:UDP-N-acetylmuramoyl-tripeptide--D-alanyl-D-alanine ligase
LLYFGELISGLKNFLQKRLKIPIFTKKIFFLIFVALILAILYPIVLAKITINISPFPIGFLISFPLSLLIFDIFTPAILSLIVFVFQPLTVLWKNQIIKNAKRKREQFKDLLVIGITGSYGKTSTKEFLAEILSQKYKVLKTKEHQNTEIGVSQCILNDLRPEDQIFICEMGAYSLGEIKLLCKICKPKIGILTGINEQHLALFGSLKNIVNTKFELIDSLPKGGVAIVNWENPLIIEELNLRIQKESPKFKIVKYSISKKEDFWAEDIEIKKEEISFKIFSKDGDWAKFKINLLGKQNIPNILAAVAVAKELGMNLKEIAKFAEKIRPEQSGVILKRVSDKLNIIDATYSANPDGVIAHLDYLKIWPGKKVIVMPCLIELGKASIEVHKKIGEKIGKVCDLAIIVTKERFKEIKKGALEGGLAKENILFLEKPKEILEKISSFLKQKEDVVLLEGRISKEIIEKLIL